MKVSSISKPPKPSQNRLIAILISERNFSVTRKFVEENYGGEIDVKQSFAEKGLLSYFFSGKQKFLFIGMGDKGEVSLEQIRRAVVSAVESGNTNRLEEVSIICTGQDNQTDENLLIAVAETLVLTNYQFLIYKSDKKGNTLKSAEIYSTAKKAGDFVKKGNKIAEATNIARDLVNEPVITLSAVEMSARTVKLGEKFGFSVEVLNKAKIKSLKMGGLLAVNFGSQLPPTFTILEWKPGKAKNKKPIIFVGKGIVYDTGGLSLKPTPGGMDTMKCDMAGAAAVIGAFCGIAALDLPVHVIGLIPATDNRPGENAYTPGDVITMYDGTTVEVLNTDAEGRLVLADALSYAKKYKPELVIDLATLTGAQVIAVGHQGSAMMSNSSPEVKQRLLNSGEHVYERLVELPLWEEYREMLKSDIADLKNIGGRPAGSITAGKFLEHFTDYPWIHIDIAGPAFLPSTDGYRPKNGTGVGVRLLVDFVSKYPT